MNETTQFALSALGLIGGILSAVISGYILSVIKSARARTLADIAQLGLQITQESEERRAGIDRVAEIARSKSETLGHEIVQIKERMAYDRGVARKPFREGD